MTTKNLAMVDTGNRSVKQELKRSWDTGCWTCLIVLGVVLVFFFMVLFVRVVPRRRY